MIFKRKHDSFPPKLPLKNLNWDRFVHLIGPANAGIGKFDGILSNIPNPAILLTPLRHEEALLSSRIEGTQASLREVLQFEVRGRETDKKAELEEVVNYAVALEQAARDLENQSLTNKLIKEAHRNLMSGVRGENKNPGEYRNTQVYIGNPGMGIRNAVYVPPPHTKVKTLMSNLEKYIDMDDRDQLVQLAIIHGQFEIIHPFTDGNGRVGRMLLPLYLYLKKSITFPSFYLSGYLEANRSAYYEALSNISRHRDWEGWIVFFLHAVIKQAEDSISRAQGIMNLYERTKVQFVEFLNSRYSIVILDILFNRPVFSSRDFVTAGIPQASAYRALRTLVKNNVVTSTPDSRYKLYFFDRLLEIVE
ncbi:MAG: Fic family protein [Gemmatimonadetes bacterium]|nr:Fic family protein [Gemmatimonadota bacterium]